jgi:hypothetical protein
MSPVHKRHHAMMQAQPLQHFLRAIRHALVLGLRFSGRHDRDQFDLGELVHADHAARVLARRTRFGAETGRPGGEAQRQFASSRISSRT